MALTEIPGTKVFFGGAKEIDPDEIRERKISKVFIIHPIDIKKIVNQHAPASRIVEVPVPYFHDNRDHDKFEQAVQTIKRTRGPMAFVCLAGAHSSPNWAINALRIKGYSEKDILEKLNALSSARSWVERTIKESRERLLQFRERKEHDKLRKQRRRGK
jgi:hypothetical protein